jgi:hypothetical protein
MRQELEALGDALREGRPSSSSPTEPPVMERRSGGSTTQEPRLGREDFDAFERSLRRKRLVRTAVIPVLLAAVAVGIWWFLGWQKRQPQTAEVEPNNELSSATLIAPGVSVRGKIRERLSPSEGDRDYFKVATGASASRPMKLTARLSPIPTMDLELGVYDRSGKLLAIADDGGVGEPEVVPNLRVTDETVFIAVHESDTVHPPTEDLTDEYHLTVSFAAPAPDEETEPDEVDSDAVPIQPGQAMHGTLGPGRSPPRSRRAVSSPSSGSIHPGSAPSTPTIRTRSS